ncbi:glycosyltransferase family 9 protein [Candidatus Omnitrophota bacterium]
MKILFITLSNIGDVILTLPVLSALKDNFPDAAIDVVVGPRPKDIFAKDPKIRDTFIYNKHAGLKEKSRFISKLRKRRYDLAVDMRSSLLPFLIGAKKKTSFLFLGKKQLKHKRFTHLDKLKSLFIEYKDRVNVYIDRHDREKVGNLLLEKGLEKEDVLIGVSPSCRSPIKEWDRLGFIEVISCLLKERKCKVVLVGDDSQVNISREITAAVNSKDLIDLTGKVSLNELFALVERMQVLLTCDSACLHIASDLKIKVVSIFGPTDSREYGPTGKNDIVIRRDITCSPCKKARCIFSHECMSGINQDEVLNAMLKALKNG